MRLIGPINSGTSTGGAGASTANTSTATRVVGEVKGIYIKYNDAPPAGTTDVTIKAVGTAPAAPTYNILQVSNAATSGWFYPRVQIHTTAGVAIADAYDGILVYDNINVAIAQANDGDSVDVWILLSDE